MRIEFNLDKIDELSPNEYIILTLVGLEDFTTLDKLISSRRREYSLNIHMLTNKGYIKNVVNTPHLEGNHLLITKEGWNLLDKKSISRLTVKESSVDSWIDDWRNLFPKGKTKNGYPIKGSRQNCIKKMTQFMKGFRVSYSYTEELKKCLLSVSVCIKHF